MVALAARELGETKGLRLVTAEEPHPTSPLPALDPEHPSYLYFRTLQAERYLLNDEVQRLTQETADLRSVIQEMHARAQVAADTLFPPI